MATTGGTAANNEGTVLVADGTSDGAFDGQRHPGQRTAIRSQHDARE